MANPQSALDALKNKYGVTGTNQKYEKSAAKGNTVKVTSKSGGKTNSTYTQTSTPSTGVLGAGKDYNFFQRVGNALSGAIKSTAADFGNAMATQYEGGQNRRNTQNQSLLEDYQYSLAREQKKLDDLIAANKRDPQKFTAKDIESQQYIVDDWQRKVNALGGVVENNVQQRATQEAYKGVDALQESSQKDIETAKQGLGKVGQFVVDVGVGGAQLAGDIGLAALSGGGTTLPMAYRVFGGSAGEARRSGATHKQQVAYGLTSAAVSALTEKIANVAAPFKKFGTGLLDDALSKLTAKPAGNILISALSEGGEEMLESAVQPLLQKLTYNPDAAYDADWLADTLYSGLIGAVLGAGGSVASPSTYANVAKQRGTNPLAPATGNAPQATTTDRTAANPAQIAENAPQIAPAEEAQTSVNDGVGAANASWFEANKTPYDRLVDQSTEFHPIGANARTDTVFEVPVKDFDGRYISRFPSNAMGAKALSFDTLETIEHLTAEGLLSDDVQHNTETMQKAEKEIGKIGSNGAMERLRNAAYNGETSPEIIAMMEALLVDADARNDKSRVAELVYLGSKLSRNSGRALQMLFYLRKMSPEYQLEVIDKIVDDINADIDSKRSKRSKEKNGESNIQIPEELRQKYLNAQNAQERNDVVSEMQQYVADNMKSTWMEKWTAIRYTNMLGNLKTPTKNIIGNVGMRFMAEINNALVAGAEKLAGGKLGNTRSLFVSPALKDAAKADYDLHKDSIVGQARYNESAMSANAFMRGVQEKRQILPIGLEQYRKGTQWIMDNQYFGDTAFMRSAYSRFLGGYLKANGVSASQFADPSWQAKNGKLIEEARTFATQQARETTFRDNNALSDWVAKIGRRKDTPWFARMAAEGFMPFRRTPANVLVRAEEYSPLGLVNAVVKGVQKARGAEITGNDIVTSLSKSVTGSALFGLGMLLLNTGWLRGTEDDEEQAAFDDLVGKQDYSIVLPDGTNLTVDWLTPASIPMFMGAKLMEILQKDDLSFRDVESVITSIAEPMLQMSMLNGVQDTLDDIKFSENNTIQMVASTALGYLSQGLTNTLLGQLERATQSTRKSTYVDKESPIPDWLQREIGGASAKTPGLDFQQIDYIDAWGRTEDSIDNGFLRLSYELLSPAYIDKQGLDDLEQELQRLHDAGVSGVFPTRAAKTIEFTIGEEENRQDVTINLSADQYAKYAKAQGQKSYQYAKNAKNSAEYKAMSPEERGEFIAEMYAVAEFEAGKSIHRRYKENVGAMQNYAEAKEEGIPPEKYYIFKEGANAASGETRQQQIIDLLNGMDISGKQKAYLISTKYKTTGAKIARQQGWQ